MLFMNEENVIVNHMLVEDLFEYCKSNSSVSIQVLFCDDTRTLLKKVPNVVRKGHDARDVSIRFDVSVNSVAEVDTLINTIIAEISNQFDCNAYAVFLHGIYNGVLYVSVRVHNVEHVQSKNDEDVFEVRVLSHFDDMLYGCDNDCQGHLLELAGLLWEAVLEDRKKKIRQRE